MSNDIELTPMMKQFLDLKAKHPDAVMLFRCGDFYETYSTDAIIAAEILGITLTKRANGKGKTIEMAGFPHHALDTYLPKLVRAGKRVAICDQLEDPKMTKKLVKRGITELVTPGVSINDNILKLKKSTLQDWDVITISQVGSSNTIFRTSPEYVYLEGRVVPYTDELKEEKLLLDAADDPEKLAQLRQEQRAEKRAERRSEAYRQAEAAKAAE